MQFIFAGKAHPNDKPGRNLIKRIVEVAAMPQFVGKIIFLQNYDMELARRHGAGVDVWLNTPTRPLEAVGYVGREVRDERRHAVLGARRLVKVEGYKRGRRLDAPDGAHVRRPALSGRTRRRDDLQPIEEQIAPSTTTAAPTTFPTRGSHR